jgi:hypothetical protein
MVKEEDAAEISGDGDELLSVAAAAVKTQREKKYRYKVIVSDFRIPVSEKELYP